VYTLRVPALGGQPEVSVRFRRASKTALVPHSWNPRELVQFVPAMIERDPVHYRFLSGVSELLLL